MTPAHLRCCLDWVEAHLAHRVQDAALHGLEAVAHVGQRARGDDRHRIREVALPHLVFDGDCGHPRVVVHGFFLRSDRMEVRVRDARRAPRRRSQRPRESRRLLAQCGQVRFVARVEVRQVRLRRWCALRRGRSRMRRGSRCLNSAPTKKPTIPPATAPTSAMTSSLLPSPPPTVSSEKKRKVRIEASKAAAITEQTAPAMIPTRTSLMRRSTKRYSEHNG